MLKEAYCLSAGCTSRSSSDCLANLRTWSRNSWLKLVPVVAAWIFAKRCVSSSRWMVTLGISHMNMVGAARWGRGVVTRGVLVLFAYRFNHRFDLRSLVATLIVDVARTGPVKEMSSEASMRQVSRQELSKVGSSQDGPLAAAR